MKTFTIISLGHRGVGKTVFLASNCIEILRTVESKTITQKTWIECRSGDFQKNTGQLIDYVIKTGNYPPPTFKVSDFSFTLKGRSIGGPKSHCQFQWLDLPGEWCQIENAEFQSVLLKSHGCCVFVDAHALLSDAAYLQRTETITAQIEAIASLTSQHSLNYPFSLICTKCDLIDLSPIGLIKLEKKLVPLLSRLDSAKASYRIFYSCIPLNNQENGGLLKSKNATEPILWLITEINTIHSSDAHLNLGHSLNRLTQGSRNSPPHNTASKNRTSRQRKPHSTILYVLVGCAIISLGAVLALNLNFFKPQNAASTPNQEIQKYEALLKQDPTNREALSSLAVAYTNLQKYDQAASLLEKARQDLPDDLDILFMLADTYASAQENSKEERTYDLILEQQGDNILALIGKARLKSETGDLKTAKTLFNKAIDSAPNNEIKLKIQEIADNNLGE